MLCAGVIEFVYNLQNMQFMSWLTSKKLKELELRYSPSTRVSYVMNNK